MNDKPKPQNPPPVTDQGGVTGVRGGIWKPSPVDWPEHAAPGTLSRVGPDDLRSAKINGEVAKAALESVERRLSDLNDVRKGVESRMTGLFSAYVSLTMAVAGLGTALAQRPDYARTAWPFFLAAALFLIGASLFAWGQKSVQGGFIGSEPEMWLVPGRIDAADDAEAARMRAYMVFSREAGISASRAGNDRKQALLNRGLACGLFGALLFVAALGGILLQA